MQGPYFNSVISVTRADTQVRPYNTTRHPQELTYVSALLGGVIITFGFCYFYLIKRWIDGTVKSSRSRLAQFRKMQRTWPYVKF